MLDIDDNVKIDLFQKKIKDLITENIDALDYFIMHKIGKYLFFLLVEYPASDSTKK